MFFKKNNKKSDPASVYANVIKEHTTVRQEQIHRSVRKMDSVNETMLKGLAQLMR